jgi:hypothetical protein
MPEHGFCSCTFLFLILRHLRHIKLSIWLSSVTWLGWKMGMGSSMNLKWPWNQSSKNEFYFHQRIAQKRLRLTSIPSHSSMALLPHDWQLPTCRGRPKYGLFSSWLWCVMGIGFSSSFTGCAFSCRIHRSHSNGLMRLIEASGIMAVAADVGSGWPSISVRLYLWRQRLVCNHWNQMVRMISVMSNQKENQTTRYQPKNPRTYLCFFFFNMVMDGQDQELASRSMATSDAKQTQEWSFLGTVLSTGFYCVIQTSSVTVTNR